MKKLTIIHIFLWCFWGACATESPTLPVEIQNELNNARELRLKDLEAAKKSINKANELATQQNNYEALYTIQKTAGIIYEDNNLLEDALVQYQNALQYAEKVDNNHYKSVVFNDIAIVNKRMGKFTIAKAYYQKSLEMAQKIQHKEQEEFSYHGLGTLYESMGEYEKAIENYWASIHLAEQRGSHEGVVNTMQNIAITYTKLKNNQTALETIEKAYQLSLNVKDTLLMGSVLFDYGKVLNSSNRSNDALLKFQESLNLFKKANFKPLIARCYFYIADTYTMQENFTLAQNYFLQCVDYKDFISVKSYTELNAKLGTLYLKQGKWQAAESAFLKSYNHSDKYQLRDLKKESATQLAKVYVHFNNFAKAYEYENIAAQLRDSLYDAAQTKGITELQFKYDTEKSEKEIQALKLRQAKSWLIFGALLLIGIVIAAIYVIRLRGKNNKELYIKNRQIEEQNRLLMEKNAALEQFAYAAAHDLKEPLRNIGSFANLLERRYKQQFDDTALEYMGFIVTGAKRMNDLLVGLLNFSALTNQRPDNEEVRLDEILEIVKANLRTAIEDKGAKIVTMTPMPSVPMHHLHMIQIFQNLIGNALKFTERTPNIKIASQSDEKSILITVEDNGIGMDVAYEAKVFRLFHRLHRHKNYEGSGIGLSICRNIVEKYGGKIWYESEVEKGTKFFISIPKGPEAVAA